MARGDMKFKSFDIDVSGIEILNREPYEGVPMTIDFTDVNTTDDYNQKVVRAGSVISTTGTVVMATPWADAAGVLMSDVYESRPQGTVLTKAYINKAKAEANASITYDSALKTVLPMIVVE